jgi:hypothetical protein
MVCPECKIEFTPDVAGKHFCCRAHKDTFHNREKKNRIIVPERYRALIQEQAAAFSITLIEALCMFLDDAMKLKDQGKPVTHEQAFSIPEKT